jgi:aspartyl-tRNA(Asn)/glutamyl-tRNA(Gln) amidotransferase subunit C
MDSDRVLKLAKLARIEISSEEAESLSHEFDAILGYVSDVKNVAHAEDSVDLRLKNVLRDDSNPHESGIYTEKLLEEAPERKDNYIKVKKIL